MTLAAVVSPYQPINGLTGLGLNNGSLYIGIDGQDPETNPQACFWDAAGATPATQPVPILGGYPMRLGTPTRIYTASTYSIRVRDATGTQVFYEAHAVAGPSEAGSMFESRASAAASNIPSTLSSIWTNGYAAAGDGGGGLYIRSAVLPTYPGSYFASLDGAYWLYKPDARGVNAKAFGAVSDGLQSGSFVYTGTDNAPAIQSAIDYAVYACRCPVYLPAGAYLIADALQLGYGDSFRCCVFEGDGAAYRGSSFAGTTIYANFSDRPGLAVNGARGTRIRGVAVLGTNLNWPIINDLMGPTPLLDDLVLANWMDPALSGTANSRYTPYAAVAVDPYAGAQPATHYPNVTYPAWIGAITQYNKAFSSYVGIEDCYFGGFVALLAIQPCNADGNGDFIKLSRVQGECAAYICTAGNSQGRLFSMEQCSFARFHSGFVNTVHGQQRGNIQLSAVSTDFEQCVQWLDIGDATTAGAFTFEECYGEQVWRIGNWGSGAGDNKPLNVVGCGFVLGAINDSRGHPVDLLRAGSPACVNLTGCQLSEFGALAPFGGSPSSYVIESCIANGGTPSVKPYEWFGRNFLGSGFAFAPSSSIESRPERFSLKATYIYDVTNGATAVGEFKNFSPSNRTRPICAWLRDAAPMSMQYARQRAPQVWDFFDKSSLAGCALVNSTLTITLAARADWEFAKKGPLPGDVLYDSSTGLVFLVRSRAGLVVLAELQNGYKVVGGAVVLQSGVVFTPLVGTMFIGNSRIMLLDYSTQGDVSAASAIFTNAGRADGFGGYMATTLLVNDWVFIDDLTDNFLSPVDAKVAAVGANTITVSGNGRYDTLRHNLGYFIQQPPANA